MYLIYNLDSSYFLTIFPPFRYRSINNSRSKSISVKFAVFIPKFSVYLAGKEWNCEYKTSGKLLKLTCGETGELSGVKVVKVTSYATLLCANINYLCVRVGNKVVIYHADTLGKVESINIGMCIYDGIIKSDNLILRTGDGQSQIKINLKDFRKKVVAERIEMLELPENLIVK